MDNQNGLAQLQAALGLQFDDKSILEQAFVHRSYLNENLGFHLQSNERLEFLGDSVIGFVVAEYLFRLFPTLSEGVLTSLRAAVVRAETLANVASRLQLGDYLFLGRGEESSGGRTRTGLLASTYEALVGAVLIDQGFEAARRFITSTLQNELARVVRDSAAKDAKSRLQEITQAKWQLTPSYRTVGAEGPDHHRVFTVEVIVGERVLGNGTGSTKRAAEQQAAATALEQLANENGSSH
jgi:ribonuclease-3